MARSVLLIGVACLVVGCGGEVDGAEDSAVSSLGTDSGITTPSTTPTDESASNSGDGDGDATGDGDGDPAGDGDGDTDTSGVKFDLAEPDPGDGDCGDAPDALVQGKVYAPNMELPISGALVYLTSQNVEAIPDEVYCAECVELDCETPYTLTGADGSFSFPAHSGQGLQLVVQKGQFLRIVSLDVNPGMNQIPNDQSNLPGEWNPGAGMWIPRIAVYETNPDAVYNVLAKFGLGQVAGNGALVPGTEQFTLIDDNDQGAFMDDLVDMSQYHIIFVPCASTKYWGGAPNIPNGRIDNIRAYVESGGKWYATDHSNEYIEGPFPSYQQFHNPGMPDIQPAYTSNGTVLDPELLAWLEALPDPLKNIGGGNPTLFQLPNLTTEKNYSGIDEVSDVWVEDMMGQNVNVGHRVWVEGPCQSCTNPQLARPMAVSGQYGCGRMMYSTFETSSTAHNGLSPQELVLLYMILEITTCFDGTPPPPPAN
ncbi:hypothetical protein [Enhygromyxa salina]|uniref:Uncharacterized protein n=1 Tax=Enhygromyxa salina TaxID=215803 RepID=A0A2S9YSV4_9BACT|nr:hypothetical protein [Enhygromyxa salina]PRQ08166.1 hypothetical protein ENSA7_21380 [Enhygromyxa salina]